MRKFLLLVAMLIVSGCGKPVSKAPPPEVSGELRTDRLCQVGGSACCDLKWRVGPEDSGENAIEIAFEPSLRSEDFRSGEGKVYAQMKCCGSVQEGVGRWEGADRYIVEKLELWPGEWLIVVETTGPGGKIQAVASIVVP